MIEKILITMRALFIATITWDFFLTVVIKTSQRAHILMGPGAVFAPFVTILWIAIIIGCFCLMIGPIFKSPVDVTPVRKFTIYSVLISVIFLYGGLTILAFINPLVLWPVVVNFMVDMTWAFALLYFGPKYQRMKEADEAKK